MTNVTKTEYAQDLLDRAGGVSAAGGDARLKGVLRDFLEQIFLLIERHDLTEDEVWGAISFLGKANEELGPVSYTHLTLPTTPYV